MQKGLPLAWELPCRGWFLQQCPSISLQQEGPGPVSPTLAPTAQHLLLPHIAISFVVRMKGMIPILWSFVLLLELQHNSNLYLSNVGIFTGRKITIFQSVHCLLGESCFHRSTSASAEVLKLSHITHQAHLGFNGNQRCCCSLGKMPSDFIGGTFAQMVRENSY